MATNNVLNAPFPLSATKGGLGVASPTIHGVLVAQGASAASPLVLGAGELLIGTTAGDPATATLTAGAGIAIDSATGAITISSTGSIGWVAVSGTSQTMADGAGYIAKNAALTTFTLPATAALGDEYEIVAYTAAGWTLLPGTTTQLVRFGNAVTTADTGSLSSTAIGDTIHLVCLDATVSGSEVFGVLSAVGNLTVV
jgi:hypothetical protein